MHPKGVNVPVQAPFLENNDANHRINYFRAYYNLMSFLSASSLVT